MPISIRAIWILVAAGALLPWVPAAPSAANPGNQTSINVHVVVRADISIGGDTPPTGSVDLGTIQTGMVCGWFRWHVDANAEAVRFYVAASDLWKGGDPQNPEVPPIPIHREGGVTFEAEHGAPARGQSKVRPFAAQMQLGDFPAWVTDNVTIESSQAGHFSQYVVTSLCWKQTDPGKPEGMYSGTVGLWGFVVPRL